MLRYPASSNQIIPEYIDHDNVSRNSGNRGETSESVRNMLNSQYGRQLSGFGSAEYGGDEDFDDRKLDKLEDQDDVVGSGIFDDAGSDATIHADMGVFADHPNLPGYIAREVQFEPNDSLVDLTTGGQVIAVPGGGMTNGGPLVGPGTIGPQLPYRYQSQLAYPNALALQVPSQAPGSVPLQTYPAALVSTQPSYLPPALPAPAPAVKAASLGAVPGKPCGCYPPPQPPQRPAARSRALAATDGAAADSSDRSWSWMPFVAGGLAIGAAVAVLAGMKFGKTAPGRSKA